MADVKCDNCGGIFHETTDKYTPAVPAKGYMLRLKEPYRSYGWDSFPENEDFGYASLECPQCGIPYGYGTGILKLVSSGITPSAIFQAAHRGPVDEKPVFRAKNQGRKVKRG